MERDGLVAGRLAGTALGGLVELAHSDKSAAVRNLVVARKLAAAGKLVDRQCNLAAGHKSAVEHKLAVCKWVADHRLARRVVDKWAVRRRLAGKAVVVHTSAVGHW